MDEATMRRREFLRTTTDVLTGLVIAGSPLALIAPGRAWAVDLAAFTSSEAATLMAVARTIAPHDELDDAAYALVVHALDTDATNDGSTRKVFRESLDRLGTEFVKAGGNGSCCRSKENRVVGILSERASENPAGALRYSDGLCLFWL